LSLRFVTGLIVSVLWTCGSAHRFSFWVAFAWILATTLVSPLDARVLGLRPSGWRSWAWQLNSRLGIAACTLFLRYRNLYALGLAHGILDLCIAISVPDAVTHHMMVGLGYLHYPH
jgi:hypothetical protein